jgi:DNA-3-methyladenine glycosylase I
MRTYHDEEWGVPSFSDPHLFEMLILEGAQAGLSWATILNKRDRYHQVFDGFDPERVAGYDDTKIDELLQDPGIVRNRLKVRAARTNALAFLTTQQVYGSFAAYLWEWVDGTPVVHTPRVVEEVLCSNPLSDRLSKDLKARGFTFVGSTILYSFLQAVGVVNDHLVTCPWKDPGHTDV